MTTGIPDSVILASLRNRDMKDAHLLYNSGLVFVAHAGFYSPATLRAVADRLADEACDAREDHERTLLLAMAAYLESEVADR